MSETHQRSRCAAMPRSTPHPHYRPLLALLLPLCLAFAGQAQDQSQNQAQNRETGTLEGRIESPGPEDSTSAPIPFANVLLEGTRHGVAADAEGRFRLEGVQEGTYFLRATAVGYQGQRQTVAVKAGQSTTANLTLQPGEALSTVVVSGTMKHGYLKDSPVKVEVITDVQLNTYLPSAASSVVESINLVNGVQEVVACGVCFTNSISINGLPGPYTSVLMDGMPIYGSLDNVYGLNGIPNMMIDRFEVIKGPNSTLYGSEAVAGVVNIITKDPQKQALFSLDLMGTTHRESFGNLGLAPRIGNTHGFIGVNWAYLNRFDDANNDGFSDAVSMDRLSLFSKWQIGRPSGKAWSLAAKAYYEDRRNGLEDYLADRAYREIRGNDSLYGESIYTKRVELFGRYELNTTLPLRLDYSASWHDQDSYYGSDGYVAQQGTGFLNMVYDEAFGAHSILAGATLRGQHYDDNTVATETPAGGGSGAGGGPDPAPENRPDNQFIPGLFVQDEWTLSKKLTLLGGLRMDHYRRHGLVWSPRLSVQYAPSSLTTLRLNGGSGFRIVNLFAEDHAFVTGQREVVIAENLAPERSWSGAVNLHQLFNIGLGTGSFDIDGFGTWFTNKVITDYETIGEINYRNVNGYALTAGGGLSVQYSFNFPLGFQASFQAQRVVEAEVDETGARTLRDIELAPRWTGVFTANYTWSKPDITFAVTANATGPMALPEVYDLDAAGNPLPNPRAQVSEPFVLANVQIEKRFGERLAVYGGVQNLLNYRQPGSPLSGLGDPGNPPGFSPFFDTAYAYAPSHGREGYIGLRWSLDRKTP